MLLPLVFSRQVRENWIGVAAFKILFNEHKNRSLFTFGNVRDVMFKVGW